MSSSRIPTYTRALHLRKLACHRNKTSCEASVCRSFSCLCGIIRNVFVSANKLPPWSQDRKELLLTVDDSSLIVSSDGSNSER